MSDVGKTSLLFANRDPDVRLMLRIRGDDPTAFQELVEKYQHRLLAVMNHLTGSHDDAEDLAQDVFMRVYRSRATYHPQAKFSTWFFTIANNVASNSRRSKKRKPTRQFHAGLSQSGFGMNPEEATVPDDSPAPDYRLHHRELSSAVADALSELNERQRTAVILNKFEDMSYEEIGGVLGITDKAVKSLLSRARAQLREILRKYVDQDAVTSMTEAEDMEADHG